MPEDRRDRSLSLERSRLSPFPSSPGSKQSLPDNPPQDKDNSSSSSSTHQWEEARCPVCMEHPHNAILLMCSSHDKGCLPYMCDTSYRHSNCFDQFRKSFGEPPPDPPEVERAVPRASTIIPSTLGPDILGPPEASPEKPKLACPLCRGPVSGWIVVEPARRFMNAKARSCACETCDYSGTYKDLRRHARSVHPLARPADVDPERQTGWQRLVRQRDLGDLLSTLRSSMDEEGRGEEGALTIDEGGWLTVFFLVRFIGPRSGLDRSGGSRGGGARPRRFRRRLWGEAYDVEEAESGGEDEEVAGGRDGGSRRNVRRHIDRDNLESE